MFSVKRITIASMLALASLAAYPAVTETPRGVERINEVMNSKPPEDEFVKQGLTLKGSKKKPGILDLFLVADAFLLGFMASVGIIMKKHDEQKHYM